MLIQFNNYLSSETIYFWINLGVLPFWLMLIFIPNSKITQFFVNSVILPLILASAYIYVIYQMIPLDESIFNVFKLYLSLENLFTVFSTEAFLLVFWLHFITLNLFLGSWILRDGFRNGMSKVLVFIPLILVYFAGPVGLVFYWLIRVFYARKLGFHD